jgi:acyl-CoA thioester hydrolase
MQHTVDIEIRFRDLDPMQHVNNALYVTYLEQARARFYEEVVGIPLAEIDTVLADLQVSYEQAIEGIGSVVVAMDVEELGTASIPMHYEIRSPDGETRYATAETVQVYFDPDTGNSKPIPDEYRSRLTG